MYGETYRLLVSSFATVARKSINGKLNRWFSDRAFYVNITDANVWSLSIHYLKSIWTTCWWNLNKLVIHEIYTIFELFSEKVVNHFEKVTPFWKTFLWHNQLFEAKVFIERISSFNVPKIIVVRHVLHKTRQTVSDLTKTYVKPNPFVNTICCSVGIWGNCKNGNVKNESLEKITY